MMSKITKQIEARKEVLQQNQAKLGGVFVMDYLGNKKIMHLVAFDFNENAKKIMLEITCEDATFSETMELLEDELLNNKVHLISKELFEKNLTKFQSI